MENKTFSHYTIIRKLGSGGMASVYLAEDNELPRQVALKLLPNQFIADKDLTERFFREARAAAKLEHPNIILIYEASVYQGQPFIAMQYIDGPTVADLISAKGRIQIEEAVSIICKVLETLEAAHKKGIFHRDIKPTNIMLKDGKYVRVIDFGIAKAQTDTNLTAVGTAFGTPAYMAPEQFSASPEANAALYDVYAVGVTFYYMLCGKLPFEGDNPYAIRDLKIYKKPANPSSMASNIPPALDEVVMKAMAANPKERYQSAQAMYDAIHGVLKASQTAIIDIKEDPAVRKEKVASRLWKSKWMFQMAAALASLISSGYFIYQKMNQSSPDESANISQVPIVQVLLAAPTLISPLDGSTISLTDKPEMIWSSKVENGGSYVLEYSINENFSQANRAADLPDSFYRPPTALENGTYFWHVQAKGNNGQMSDFSKLASFVMDKQLVPPSPQEGIISITVNDSSSILIDGKIAKANSTNWEGNVAAGSHKVRIENPASVEKIIEESISITAGGRTKKSYAFTFPQTTTELVVATGNYSAKIFVDGQFYSDRGPVTITTLAPGEHEIKVIRNEDGLEMREKINIEIGTSRTLRFYFDTNKTEIL